MSDIRILSIKKNNLKYDLLILKDDSKYSIKISEDLLIEMKFLSLKKIDDDTFNKFLSKLPLDTLYLDSLKYVDKKIRSRQMVFDHLLTKTSSTELINECLDILEKRELINDELFKKELINYLINVKQYGRSRIIKELSDNKLSTSFIYDEHILKNNIISLTTKYNKKNTKDSYKTKIDKCKLFLYSKGYSEDDINKYFNYSLIASNNESLIKKDIEKLKGKENKNLKFELLKKGYSLKEIEEYL